MAAPFLPPANAPIAIPAPVTPAVNNVSRFQRRRGRMLQGITLAGFILRFSFVLLLRGFMEHVACLVDWCRNHSSAAKRVGNIKPSLRTSRSKIVAARGSRDHAGSNARRRQRM